MLLPGMFTVLMAQEKFTEGIWMSAEDPVFFESPGLFYHITADAIRQASLVDGEFYYTMDKNDFTGDDGVSYQEESSTFMGNNAICYWINSCDGCGWTETQVMNLFYIGSPYVYYFEHNRYVNNYDAEEINTTFEEDGSSFTNNTSGYLRLIPGLLKQSDEIIVGGKSTEVLQLLEVRVTDMTTEISMRLTAPSDEYGCSLHAPGSDNAYVLTDGQGRSYSLLGNFGWDSDGDQGFGSRTLDKYDVIEFVLFFEPMPVETRKFTLREGNCEQNCWNFYDVRLTGE